MTDPILTQVEKGKTYIISQVRTCIQCKQIINSQTNLEPVADDENRIFLWQHKDCKKPEYESITK